VASEKDQNILPPELNKFEFNPTFGSSLTVDLHAHILPQISNGPASMELAVELCEMLQIIGFRQIVATPHIMKGFYDYQESDIVELTAELNQNLKENNVAIKVKAAADYYVDNHFYEMIRQPQRLLTLESTKNEVLLECSFTNGFEFLEMCLNRLINLGYAPVISHPEKHSFLFDQKSKLEKLQKLNVKFMVGTSSYLPSRNKTIKENLNFLTENNLVSYVATNIKTMDQWKEIHQVVENPVYLKTLNQNLINNELIF
jgi:protein-tyrosine phosphatase